MSESSAGDNKPLDLSSLQLVPDWVAQLDAAPTPRAPAPDEARDSDPGPESPRTRKPRRGPGGGDFDRGRPPQGRSPRRDDRPRRDGPPRGRHDGGDRRGGPHHQRRDGPQQKRPELPKWLVADVLPTPESVDFLVKRIRLSGRALALFDVAKVVLEDPKRFQVRFSLAPSAKPEQRLYRCSADESLWLKREDALRHFVQSPALENYYDVEIAETEPPKGDFKSVAICGMSGVMIGPPNHHSYQTAVIRLHQQRFANMPIERFKSRIRVETAEEKIEQWRQEQSRVTTYRFPKVQTPNESEPESLPELSAVAPEEVPVPESEAATATPAEATEAAEADALIAMDDAAANESGPAPAESEAPSSESETPAPEEEAPVPDDETDAKADDHRLELDSPEALFRHLTAHLADQVVEEVRSAVVPGTAGPKSLAPPLSQLLRQQIDRTRQGPFPLVKALCAQFEKKGLKIFKRQGRKLFVSKARPRPIDPAIPLSDSIQMIIDVVRTQPGIKVSELVVSLAPRRAEEDQIPQGEFTPAETAILSDLHWLIDEGLVIEYASSALFLGCQPRKEADKPSGETKGHPDSEPGPTTDAVTGAADSASISSTGTGEDPALPQAATPAAVDHDVREASDDANATENEPQVSTPEATADDSPEPSAIQPEESVPSDPEPQTGVAGTVSQVPPAEIASAGEEIDHEVVPAQDPSPGDPSGAQTPLPRSPENEVIDESDDPSIENAPPAAKESAPARSEPSST